MNYRENTDDLRMIQEVIEKDIYKSLKIDDKDIVLNLGANIGTFDEKYNSIAKQIISVEPLPENIEIFKSNINYENCILLENAVSNSDNEVISFYSNFKNFAGGSILKKKGYKEIKVKTISLKTLIEKYNPTKMKCDIEGAEFELDWDILKSSNIKSFFIEIHNSGELRKKIIPLIEKFKSLGYNTSFDKKEITHNFCLNLLFWR